VPRQARLDAPGTLHHVIIRGIERRRIVDDDEDRQNFISRLGNLVEESETRIYAWSLMSNHAHLLLRSGPSGLPKFMRRFLTGYAVTYNLRHLRHGHLFQNRYHSIVCDEDVYLRELVRYIHLNPIRANLVSNLSELDRYRKIWGDVVD
jgi:putative transposase